MSVQKKLSITRLPVGPAVMVPCPLCKGKKFKKLYHAYGMDVVSCLHCGLIFTNPQLLQKRINQYYNQDYYFSPKKDANDRTRYADYNARYLTGNESKRFDRVFEKLSYYKPKKGRLVDVGCASGFFLQEAAKKGWKTKGVEVSRWAANWGEKNLKMSIFNGQLVQAKFPGSSFDVVTMFDSLEHIKDPQKELLEVSRVLKKGGLLYVETINFDNFITKNIIGGKYVFMVPQFHLYFFGRKQLKQMLQKAGFQLLETSLWSSSVGDYEYSGFKMYWQYLKILLSKKRKAKNLALNDVIKIFAKKI